MKTNWIEIYQALNEREPQKINGRISPYTDELELEAINEIAMDSTIEQLKAFKRETKGLTPPEIVAFIDAMNIQPPKPMFEKTPYPHHNKAFFRVQRNFVQFIKDYRQSLLTTEKPARGLPFDYTPQAIDFIFSQFRGVFIPQGTRYENFEACFSGKQVPTDFKPVVWLDDLTKLAYFLTDQNDATGANVGQLWNAAARLFVDAKGNHFTGKQLKKANQGKAVYPDVDKVINELANY